MKALVEPLEGNKVKLSVEVDEQEFEEAVTAAFRKIAQEVRIPGFRPGKAPRRVLEARLGKEAGRAEALREALPDYYARAVRDNEVDAIAAPEIDITQGEDAGPLAFDAIVEVRPHLHLAGYNGLRVEVPSPEITEEDITGQIDRLRANFGELKETDSPAADGFHLTLDLAATRDGETVGALTTDDFVYELGSGAILPELDEQLQGVTAGETRTFEADMDGTVNLEVKVKDVKENVLPEVTDEWASEASEYETVEELRADIIKRTSLMKRYQANVALRNGTVEALVQLVDSDPPAALVDSEVERQAHELGHRLEAQGATFEQYLQATGQSQEEFVAGLREGAVPAVKADLALRSVAESEEINPTDDDLVAEIDRLAAGYQMMPGQLLLQLQRNDQLPAVRSDLRKSKALEWLIEHVELVDTDGQPVDRALLSLDDADDADTSDDAETSSDASDETSIAAETNPESENTESEVDAVGTEPADTQPAAESGEA